MHRSHLRRACHALAVLLCLGAAGHPVLAADSTVKPKTKRPAEPPAATLPTKRAPATRHTAPSQAFRGAAPGPALRQTPVDANAARGMRDLKDMGAGLSNLPARPDNDLRNPGGADLTKQRGGSRFPGVPSGAQQGETGNARLPAGMPPAPALPSNSTKRPRSVIGAPSHNLRDHMGGSSGSVDIGDVDVQTDTRRSSVQFGDVTTEVAPSGGVRIGDIKTEVAPSGGGSVHIGDMSVEVAQETPKEPIKDDIAKTQDPNADVRSGGCNPVTGDCRGAPATDPNRTNPGPEGAAAQPTAARVQIDRKGLVTNPAQPRGFASGRVPRRPENTANRVNPPNPNDVPR